jgi:hypothetical protein
MPEGRRLRKLLGEVMLEKGLITPRQLSDALRAQEHANEKLGRILVNWGYVSELDMFRSVSEQYGLPFPTRFLPYFHRERPAAAGPTSFAAVRRRLTS